jgi:hypothetical protein
MHPHSRLMSIPTCTEEMYEYNAPGVPTAQGRQQSVRLVAGARTVTTSINCQDQPPFDAIDDPLFDVGGDTLRHVMYQLKLEHNSYMRWVRQPYNIRIQQNTHEYEFVLFNAVCRCAGCLPRLVRQTPSWSRSFSDWINMDSSCTKSCEGGNTQS